MVYIIGTFLKYKHCSTINVNNMFLDAPSSNGTIFKGCGVLFLLMVSGLSGNILSGLYLRNHEEVVVHCF